MNDAAADLVPRPLIAVTTTLVPGGRHNLPRVSLNAQYVAAVERPGGAAVLVTPAHDPASVRRLVEVAHGLVLTGGEDVNPARFGEAPHPTVTDVSDARDEAELAALEAALARGMPVLAICRGVQLLNVALGGTLWQDLPSQLGGDVLHEQTAGVAERWHRARVEPGSHLAEVFGAEELFINSFHHQAVKALAPDLVATAWAEDGVIEGVEHRTRPWVCGVQWHPERGEADLPEMDGDPDRRLFAAFVQAARAFAAAEAMAER